MQTTRYVLISLRNLRFDLLFSCICTLSFVAVFPSHAADAPAHIRLFADTYTRLQAEAGRYDGRVYPINRDAFFALSSGEADSVIIPLPVGDVLFHRSFSRSREKTSTWTGRDSNSTTIAVMTLGADHLFARITGPSGVLLVKPSLDPFSVITYQPDQRYEVDLVHDAVPVPDEFRYSDLDSLAVADDGTRIDMMIGYTSGMAAAYPGGQIDTRIQYLIDQANLSFRNSGIHTRFNLVHSQEYAYPDNSSADMDQALGELTAGLGVFANVETQRKKYGADQVTLLRRFVDEGCGLAWLLKREDARNAYAIVHDGDKTDGSGFYCSDLTYVHEVGHNLGCAHDRDNAGIPGRFTYSYGYQEPAGAFRTVMAYDCAGGCIRIPYFSNPDVLFNGKPTGVAATEPLAADNAQSINRTRVGMAGYFAEVDVTVSPPPGSAILPLPAIIMMLDGP